MRSRHSRQSRRRWCRSFRPDRCRPHPSNLPYLSRRLCPSRRPCRSILPLPSSHLRLSRRPERPRSRRKSHPCPHNRPNRRRPKNQLPHRRRSQWPRAACSPPRENRTKAERLPSGLAPARRVERSHLVHGESNCIQSSGASLHFGTRGPTAHFDLATGSCWQPTARPGRETRLADRACGNGPPAPGRRCRGGQRPPRPT